MDTPHGQPLPHRLLDRCDAVVLGEAALARLRRGEPCDVLVFGDQPCAATSIERLQAAFGEGGYPVVLAAGEGRLPDDVWLAHAGTAVGAATLADVGLAAKRPPAAVRLGEGLQGVHAAALAAIAEGVLLCDARQRITHANAAALRLTGHGEAEVLGQTCEFLWGESADAATVRRLQEAFDGGRAFAAVLAARRKSGEAFWAEFSLTPVLDAAGTLVHFVGVLRDVTVSHALEEQLRHAQKLDVIDHLSGGVAHDFNNLLTIITGNVELLEALGHASPDIADPLHEISQAARRAAVLTRQLLLFGRKQDRTAHELDLTEVVDQMAGMLRRLVGDGIRVKVHHGVRPALVSGDQGMLEQILMNLCVNARDAMPTGGTLKISVEPSSAADIATRASKASDALEDATPRAWLRLTVADNGCGIPADRRERIFEPFFTTKGAGKGTGLGLATVRSIARQHGGACGLESEVGRGTRVFVWLPALDANAASAGGGADAQDPPGA